MKEPTKLILLGCVVLFAAISALLTRFPEFLGAYYYDIIIGVGISVILAVGLNLVNGYTGQFSLGHAGFMGLGAYLGSRVPDWDTGDARTEPRQLITGAEATLDWEHDKPTVLALREVAAGHVGLEILEEPDRPLQELLPEPEFLGELRAPQIGLGD